jgi:hypothetical protein
VSNIIIDTPAAVTDTIEYVATDAAGNTATSTRTVIIVRNSRTRTCALIILRTRSYHGLFA